MSLPTDDLSSLGPHSGICAAVNRYPSFVNLALTPAHLVAIGRVAVEWNLLEREVLDTIADIIDQPFDLAVILCGHSSFASWTDILRNLTAVNFDFSWKAEQLKSLCKRMLELLTERNGVVHAQWLLEIDEEEFKEKGFKGFRPKRRAIGIGIPKRGLKVQVEIEKTPEQIRHIAKRIHSLVAELRAWRRLQQPKRGKREKPREHR